MSAFVLPSPITGTLTINVETTSSTPPSFLFGLSGGGIGWSANGTELTLQPTGTEGAYYKLALELTEGFSFATPAAQIWGPNSEWGVVLSGTSPSLQVFNHLSSGLQYFNVAAVIQVGSGETMPFSFIINLLASQ